MRRSSICVVTLQGSFLFCSYRWKTPSILCFVQTSVVTLTLDSVQSCDVPCFFCMHLKCTSHRTVIKIQLIYESGNYVTTPGLILSYVVFRMG